MATVAEIRARERELERRAEERRKQGQKEFIMEQLFAIGIIFLAILAICFIYSIPEIIADIICK